MMLYKIMLALFTFGFVIGAINAAGIYDVAIPDTTTTIDEESVVKFTEAQDDPLNYFFIFSAISTALHVLGSAFLAVITILPQLHALGIPVVWGMMIQGPIWLVEIWGIYQFKTGYQTQGMD